MNLKTTVLFQQALAEALQVTVGLGTTLGDEIVLVRDLHGRIRPILKTRPAKNVRSDLEAYKTELAGVLGSYGFAPDRSLLFIDELVEPASILSERRLLKEENGLRVYLLDRQIIGLDWMRKALDRTTINPRVTFYGIKGGVGRSTALANWAWHLARQGKKVLVFDLDLESPGVSSTLLPPEHLPDYGIVDWFVEDGVGQAAAVQSEMVALSPLAKELDGEIRVVPAYGSKTDEYIPKLARCYAEFSGNAALSWAERLQKLVEALESDYTPDVVILDSRAGLHDIAAVLATRMESDTLLFAIDSPQTWTAYRLLFKHWKDHPSVDKFRRHLQIVAGMVPETGRDAYLESFRENAWELFRVHLYDETSAGEMGDFSFDLDDESAPHSPLPIFWHRALQEFNPSEGGIDTKTASDAFGTFFEQADQLLVTASKEDS